MNWKIWLIVAAAFVAGLFVGLLTQSRNVFGYSSYSDCVLGEARLQPNPRIVRRQLETYCSRFD
jgi:hypothetical protein